MSQTISIVNLLPLHKRSLLWRMTARLLDRLLGINRMNQLYLHHNMAGLEKQRFAEKLLEILNIQIEGQQDLLSSIPESGPVIIAANHPFGGIEGVILSYLIGQRRPDLKVLANQGLKLFPELQDYFIFTNPLAEGDPRNAPSIRQSLKHVKSDGALLIFPAGRVAYFQKEKQRISDHHWNRLVAYLCQTANAPYLGLFVKGYNSRLFYRLGRIYYRFRLLLLARELLNKTDHNVSIYTSKLIKASKFSSQHSTEEQAQICRAISYCQDPEWRYSWPADQMSGLQPIAAATPWRTIEAELCRLPAEQLLITHKQFSVYYGFQSQLPKTVHEIARLREWVFRLHNEGSGEPIDTDDFDASYTQLFVVNNQEQRIVGAYRMGQTDKLITKGGLSQLYLSRMFDFKPGFVNQQSSCLELGRSFLIPDYQRSFQGLFLLWRGIGAFVCKFPQYRTLYGTVSLSKLYDPRSVALIEAALVTEDVNVKPRSEFSFALHPELAFLSKTMPLAQHLSALLASIEQDGKDIPVLAKHYQKLGARFHCLGIDRNFNDTPGLLLSVALPDAPEKLLRLYMGEHWKAYVNAN